MERHGRTPRRSTAGQGPGWLATLGGALLLMAVGFGVGLGAAVGWEEPRLVMDHLMGRTTEVPLVAEGGEPPERREAAPRPPLGSSWSSRTDAAAPGDPAVSAAPPAAPREATRAPGSGEGFSIQVGAFGDRAPARGLARELRQLGFTAAVFEEGGARAPFKVRVGPVASRAEADRLAARLEKEHRLPTWVFSQESR